MNQRGKRDPNGRLIMPVQNRPAKIFLAIKGRYIVAGVTVRCVGFMEGILASEPIKISAHIIAQSNSRSKNSATRESQYGTHCKMHLACNKQLSMTLRARRRCDHAPS